MPRSFFSSLRSRAILLVLLAVLPLLALTLYSYFDQRDRAVREVQRDELVTARNLATVQETLINNTRQLLTSLAQFPQVQRRDRDGCDALFARLLEQCPYYAVLGAVDPEGWVFASAPVAQERFNVTSRLWFQKVLQTRDFSVGETLLGRISHKYSIILSSPILDEQGQLQGVIYAGFDLQWLGSLLAKSDLPPSTALVLTDGAWKVLFRYPEPLKYIGKLLPDVLIRVMTNSNEGVTEGVGLPGDARLFAFARLSPPWENLRLAIGLPREWALAQVNRDLRRNLIWLGLVSFLAMVAARFGGNIFILRPVEKLLDVTRRLTGGDLTARTAPPYQAGELGQLAQAFDHMADALQQRDADLTKAAEELKSRVRELDHRSQELEAANKELEAFAYSVSHDLRAPLRSIGGFARVLLEDYPDKLDDDGRRYLNIIHNDARKMGQLIDDLLALSRLGRKKMGFEEIDMAALVRSVFTELQGQAPERLVQFDAEVLPPAHGDRTMLRQVLVNLLQNSLNFTKNRETAIIRVTGWSEGWENVYCFKDNGVGFDMRYANKLFEVFQRLHTDREFAGTGVGLAIVKRIIDRHGGRLWAEGKVDEGATFCFTLPK